MVAATAKSEQALKCSDAAQNMRLTGSTRTVSTSETMAQMLLHKHERLTNTRIGSTSEMLMLPSKITQNKIIRTTEQALKTGPEQSISHYQNKG
jgi:aldehyde:ferredoxin oxidoreductase